MIVFGGKNLLTLWKNCGKKTREFIVWLINEELDRFDAKNPLPSSGLRRKNQGLGGA